MLKIINGGLQSVVEDWPGRLGHMGNGMAPAGAMDNVALGFGNLLVGNPIGEAGIEIAAGYFQGEFQEDSVIAVTGCNMQPTINNESIPMWESIKVNKGDIIKFAGYSEVGFRSYISIAGGINVPIYLGSKSTCLFGNYGGYKGRPLKKDDVLKFGETKKGLKKFIAKRSLRKLVGRKLKKEIIPKYSNETILRVIVGMNAYPDFVSEKGMDFFFNNSFQVTINSNRSACRLSEIPDNFFSRDSGGVGGSHPSNIVDHAYNMRGAINVTGNTPSILIADGPTLGGFMCCANVINADLWKVGQSAPGRDHIKFVQVDQEDAIEARRKQRALFTEDSLI
jgi:biotin-dependent carboxylase-like uncharacterized protein